MDSGHYCILPVLETGAYLFHDFQPQSSWNTHVRAGSLPRANPLISSFHEKRHLIRNEFQQRMRVWRCSLLCATWKIKFTSSYVLRERGKHECYVCVCASIVCVTIAPFLRIRLLSLYEVHALVPSKVSFEKHVSRPHALIALLLP